MLAELARAQEKALGARDENGREVARAVLRSAELRYQGACRVRDGVGATLADLRRRVDAIRRRHSTREHATPASR